MNDTYDRADSSPCLKTGVSSAFCGENGVHQHFLMYSVFVCLEKRKLI